MADFTIYNCDRYGASTHMPEKVLCKDTTLEKAEFLAAWMSQYYPGQEGMWLVEGHEDNN